MNKFFILLFFLAYFSFQCTAQKRYHLNFDEPKTLLLEKIGTHHRYGYEPGDVIKFKTKNHLIISDYLWEIGDSVISVGQSRPVAVQLKEIESVYPQFTFPRKFGMYMFIAGMAYFTVVSFNHLINNEIVFTRDVFVIPTALFATGLVSVSLSQKRCKIGDRWKLKVVGIRIL